MEKDRACFRRIRVSTLLEIQLRKERGRSGWRCTPAFQPFLRFNSSVKVKVKRHGVLLFQPFLRFNRTATIGPRRYVAVGFQPFLRFNYT